MRIHGVVKIAGSDIPTQSATLRIYVEDTARIDARATVIAQSATPLSQLAPTMPFDLTCREPLAQERLMVRVHLDMDNSGEVSSGDFVSTAAHPASPNPTEISVQRVG